MPTKIEVQKGNLLNVSSGHVIHGCNACGVMGSGVALGVKNKWPQVYRDYLEVHNSSGLILGESYPTAVSESLCVWNAITQKHYGRPGRMVSYDAIQSCFEAVNDWIKATEGSVLAPAVLNIPQIGAARGGGNWTIISTIIEETVDYPVILWLPDSTVTTI
jgi:O-acetyl-ADP-ribose deacetylase (regulator of RNase III)